MERYQRSERTWQVVDRQRPDGDRFRTLALIHLRADADEVMQFGDGFEWTTCTSVELAPSRAEGLMEQSPPPAPGRAHLLVLVEAPGPVEQPAAEPSSPRRRQQ